MLDYLECGGCFACAWHAWNVQAGRASAVGQTLGDVFDDLGSFSITAGQAGWDGIQGQLLAGTVVVVWRQGDGEGHVAE